MRLVLLAACAWFAHAAITLESPREYQVFQRDPKGTGKVVVRGRAASPCETAEVNGATLPVDAATCVFHGELALPEGGW